MMDDFGEMAHDEDHGAERPGWPVAIGVVSIVFGALGLLGGCLGLVFVPLIEPFTDWVADATNQPPEAMGLTGLLEWKVWVMALVIVSVPIATLLLVGGVKLSRRRPGSAGLLVAWAIAKMVFVIANALVGFGVNQSQFEAAKVNPATTGVSPEASKVMNDVFTGIGVVWGWALPVFLLIWFARRKVKVEVASWRDSWSDMSDALPR